MVVLQEVFSVLEALQSGATVGVEEDCAVGGVGLIFGGEDG